MTPDCSVCGESHAEVDCPIEICATCWRLCGCDCRDPEPVSIADWIAAGRPEARRLPEPVDPEEARADAAYDRWKAERNERLIAEGW